METQGTFFVAKKQQPQTWSIIDFSWSYQIQWKTLINENCKLLIKGYKDEGKIKNRKSKHFMLCIFPVPFYVSSIYPEWNYFTFDYKGKFYKLQIDQENQTALIKKYHLLE